MPLALTKQTAASVTTPPSGKVTIFVDSVTGQPYYKDSAGVSVPLDGGTAWGDITGTLSGQTDLQSALDAKLDDSQATAFGLSLLGGADAAAGRTALALGTLSTQNGTFSGTSSGTNTGDQTITLTGDVTGSGTGSFATTLVTNQPAVHTWALAQTFTVSPVFTDQSGSRTALGLGTAAVKNTGTSGNTVPLLDGANIWSDTQQLTSGKTLNWNGDAFLSRRGAANIQLGAADAASPVAQTLSVQGARGGTDSNTAAVNTTIVGSLGTGTGTIGDIVFKAGTAAASGTTAHTATTVLTLNTTACTFSNPLIAGSNFTGNNGGANFIWAGSVSFTGSTFTGNNACSLFSFKANVIAEPTTRSLTNRTMYVVTNEGATSKPVLTLLTAVAGDNVRFVVQDSDGIRIAANTGDNIRIIDKVTANAGYIESTTIGSVVHLVAINATEWIAIEVHGVWTDGTFTFDDTGLTTP